MEDRGYTQDGTVDLRGRPVVASKTGKWKACSFLLGYEAFERMAFWGVASNLVQYLTTELHENTVVSVRNVNNWSGSVWMSPILGAYLADTYFGRFWTFTVSAFIYFSGMVLLTLAVSIKSLKPTCSHGVCEKASAFQIGFFYASLYVIVIGAGGTKPNISTFGADQFDDFDPHEKKLKASFFNWWMFSSFLGGLLATLVLVYVQENVGWGLGYGIPTAGMALSLVIFYMGTGTYRHKVRKTKSPTKALARVWAEAYANRRLELPRDPAELYEHDAQHYVATGKRRVHYTPAYRFLDKAAVREGKKPCSVTQVQETKLVLGMFLVWLTTLVPNTIFAQVNTIFVKQGATLDRTVGRSGFKIPSASLSSSITISVLLAVPFYDRCFMPFMRRRTGHPKGITPLWRLGVGFFFHILVTTVAYSVEVRRMRVIKESGARGPNDVVPMSIFWLLPQYVLVGIGDLFNAIGIIEFFYDQSPEDMQSLGTTFFTSGFGVGNFINSLLVTVVDKLSRRHGGKSWLANNLNDSRLDHYYAFLAIISAVNLILFLWVASGFHYKKESLVSDDQTDMKSVGVGNADTHPSSLEVQV